MEIIKCRINLLLWIILLLMVSPFKRYDGRPDMSSDILFIDGQIDTITLITSGVYRILGKASEIKVVL